jgi:HlyD family secretion protein
VRYQYRKLKLKAEAALANAKNRLEQVTRDGEADLAEAKARKDAVDLLLERQEMRLAKYTGQLKKCKIYAPADGIVAYATSRSWYSSYTRIREGAFVRQRQHILTLPALHRMQVKTAVHESVRSQIEVGMPATIRVDALPGRVYKGSVQYLSVMPDPGGILDSDVKVYDALVTIDEDVQRLKPGMTAVVEIHVAQVKDVLCVPVEAVVQIDGDNWCYVEAEGGVERRVVALGRTNEELVEVREGLVEGERVVLDPSFASDSDQESGRAVSSSG